MRGLIGYSGFVGSNLLKQTHFDKLYNSKNIQEITGETFDILICSGAPAVKWKANKEPELDLASIQNLIDNLKNVKAKRLILISTIDVYKMAYNVDEDTCITKEELDPYGKHRYLLEEFVKSHFDKVNIIRLPGLFGEGLKKNIIYDFIHNNDLGLIHSGNVFQFYNLERLHTDIEIAIKNDLPLVNFATEPVSVNEIAIKAFDRDFINLTEKAPANYNMLSKYARLFNGNARDNYVLSKIEQLDQIRKFAEANQ